MRPAFKAKTVVTDREIETLLLMREEYKTLKGEMDRLKQQLDDHEADIIAWIDAGASVSSRFYGIDVRETERRFPAWKEHVIELAGKDAADDVLEATEPKLYRSLVVKTTVKAA